MEYILEPQNNRIVGVSAKGETLAEITFPLVRDGVMDINHTFVNPSLRGQGVAGVLMERAIAYAEAHKLQIIPSCPYAAKWFSAHPEKHTLLASLR